MILDHRVYTAKPNRLALFLETYRELGFPLQQRYLGQPVGFFVSHIGPLNRIVHIWAYASLADREARRQAMEADPDWQAFLSRVRVEDTLAEMENQILKPAPFFEPPSHWAQAAGS